MARATTGDENGTFAPPLPHGREGGPGGEGGQLGGNFPSHQVDFQSSSEF